MNLALYQIADAYLSDIARLQDTELDEQTIADTIEAMGGDLETKATNVAMFIKNLDASAKQIKEAEKAMAERRKSIENKAEHIRNYLLANMVRTGITKIECPYFAISVRKNPPSVVVDDESSIPDTYFDTPPPLARVLNKNRLKDDLKNGVVVDGAHLESGSSLQIR